MKNFSIRTNKDKIIINILGIKISLKKFHRLVQDKKSEVEFYLIDAFEIYHFLPIYNALLNKGIRTRIIAEPCTINTSGQWFDYDTAIKILKENDIDYRTKCNPKAKIAITTQRADILKKYKNKKVNLSYGCGFTKNYFNNGIETCKGFDYKLAHGEYSKNLLKEFIDSDKILIVGYPKHNEFFKNIPTKESIKKELNIDTNKPILTYFPTWDNDASIKAFGSEIVRLKDKFFIVTKPHHCTFRLSDKAEDLKKIYTLSDLVLEGNYSFEKASILGDIAIVDAKSGASTEIPYLNKSISLILLLPREDYKEYFVPKTFDFAKIISKPQDLYDNVLSIFDNDTYKNNRIDFIKQIYEDNNYDGLNIIVQRFKKDLQEGVSE